MLRKRSLSISKALGCYSPILCKLASELRALCSTQTSTRTLSVVVTSLGCILGVFTERKLRFRMGKLHCVAMAAQYQQPNENTGWLYGCLGMAPSISKSQQAFQEDQHSPPRHRQENRHRKSHFSHYTRQQRATGSLCSFLPQSYAAPALSSTNAESSTNALPVGSAELQVSRERARRRQLLHPSLVCPCPMSESPLGHRLYQVFGTLLRGPA